MDIAVFHGFQGHINKMNTTSLQQLKQRLLKEIEQVKDIRKRLDIGLKLDMVKNKLKEKGLVD